MKKRILAALLTLCMLLSLLPMAAFAAEGGGTSGDTTVTDPGTLPEHTHGNWAREWSSNETHHWRDCLEEGCNEKMGEGAHYWGASTIKSWDATTGKGTMTHSCQECKYVGEYEFEHPHNNWATEWSKDQNGHWIACKATDCDGIKDQTWHSYTSAIKSWDAAAGTGILTLTCTICGYSYDENFTHSHSWQTDGWSWNNTHHWHDCRGDGPCPTMDDVSKSDGYAAHSWVDEYIFEVPTATESGSKSAECSVCGTCQTIEIPAHTHTPDSTWSTDETYHWHECTASGCYITTVGFQADKQDAGAHEYSSQTDTTCNTCGYVRDLSNGLPKLSDPANLRWITTAGGTEINGTLGTMLWDITGTYQNQCRIYVYKVGTTEPVFWTNWYTDNLHIHTQERADFFIFECDSFESGDYYFTVQNLGDGTQYADGNVVSSLNATGGLFHYTKPTAQLPAPAKGSWEWPKAMWTKLDKSNSIPTDQIYTYIIEYGISDTIGGEIRFMGWSSGATPGREDSWLQDQLIGENGAGYYYFRIRAISSNINERQNGVYGPWSNPYDLSAANAAVKDALDNLANKTPEKIKEGVQALNTTELANAMRSDLKNNDNGTINTLAALEEAAGGPAAVEVASEIANKLTPGDISVVGANLNTSEGTVKLNVGPPAQEHVRDEIYSNTIAVSFSMDLDNVDTDNSKELQVPVKITMPIPSTINPQFLVILHYDQYGNCREELVNCYQENGKWFVSFVVTHFSDFVMTERVDGGSNTPGTPQQPQDPGTVTPVRPGGSTIGGNRPSRPTSSSNTPKPGTTSTPTQPGNPAPATFTDVSTGNWFAEAVDYVVAKGLMNGVGNGAFNPNGTATRAMIMTMLARYAGENTDGGATWYEKGMAWSVANNVSDGSNPNGTVTREQLVTMLWRYAGSPEAEGDLAAFPDAASTHDWAESAMQWAVSNGIIEGSNGNLNPAGNATRAQVAAILMRFCQLIEQ